MARKTKLTKKVKEPSQEVIGPEQGSTYKEKSDFSVSKNKRSILSPLASNKASLDIQAVIDNISDIYNRNMSRGLAPTQGETFALVKKTKDDAHDFFPWQVVYTNETNQTVIKPGDLLVNQNLVAFNMETGDKPGEQFGKTPDRLNVHYCPPGEHWSDLYGRCMPDDMHLELLEIKNIDVNPPLNESVQTALQSNTSHLFDRKKNTRFVIEQLDQVVVFDLGEKKKEIVQIRFGLYKGSTRQYNIRLFYSIDGKSFEQHDEIITSGKTDLPETYYCNIQNARYIAFQNKGNNDPKFGNSGFLSLTYLEIYGRSTLR